MKFAILILSVIVATAAFAAEAPSAYYVAASILKDSGIDDATRVSGTHVGTEGFGSGDKTIHILRFHRGIHSYTCDYTFRASELSGDRFAVRAELKNCRNESENLFVLNNDYTNENGQTLFERVFFNNNRQFRPLNSEEQELFASRSRRTNSDESSIRVVNPQNTDRVIIFNEGQIIPLN